MAMDRERPRGRKRRKVCTFCVDKVEHIDYKDAVKLRRFLSERSKILPRRTTGTCAMHQRQSDRAAALRDRLIAEANERPALRGWPLVVCIGERRAATRAVPPAAPAT